MTSHTLPRFLGSATFAALLFLPSAALAAGSEDAPPSTSPTASTPANPGAAPGTPSTKAGVAAPTAASLYQDGKAAISRKDWKVAITALSGAAKLESGNADIHNLLGYSYRKTADYKNAFANYALALKFNPKHKGALEYQGEAYAETGDLTKAKANLTKLKTVCGTTTCEEYLDLATFIKAAEAKKAAAKKK